MTILEVMERANTRETKLVIKNKVNTIVQDINNIEQIDQIDERSLTNHQIGHQ